LRDALAKRLIPRRGALRCGAAALSTTHLRAQNPLDQPWQRRWRVRRLARYHPSLTDFMESIERRYLCWATPAILTRRRRRNRTAAGWYGST